MQSTVASRPCAPARHPFRGTAQLPQHLSPACRTPSTPTRSLTPPSAIPPHQDPQAATPAPLHISPAARLRAALTEARSSRKCLVVPGCADALSAKLVARDGGFEAAFFSGFGASATRLGQPDAGIISYAEMEDAGEGGIDGGA